jgi:hypothetical protein
MILFKVLFLFLSLMDLVEKLHWIYPLCIGTPKELDKLNEDFEDL